MNDLFTSDANCFFCAGGIANLHERVIKLRAEKAVKGGTKRNYVALIRTEANIVTPKGSSLLKPKDITL